jgi:hypothetical protein
MPKEYPLTQGEVDAAEIYAFKIGFAMLLHTLLREHPRKDAAVKELADGVAQIADSLPYGDIASERRDAFRSVVREKASTLIRLSQDIERHQLQ